MVNTKKKEIIEQQPDIEVKEIDLPDDEIKWCSVALSEVLNNDNRLEASVLKLKQNMLGKNYRIVNMVILLLNYAELILLQMRLFIQGDLSVFILIRMKKQYHFSYRLS